MKEDWEQNSEERWDKEKGGELRPQVTGWQRSKQDVLDIVLLNEWTQKNLTMTLATTDQHYHPSKGMLF